MALLKNGQIVADVWNFVADHQPIPESGPVAVSFERFAAERETLLARPGVIGLTLCSDQSPRALGPDAPRLNLIRLEFPKFTDGRPYSAARLLRERFGFHGELRATGNVLRDQLGFMWRCGFDAFDIPDSVSAAKWLAALNEITVHMQPATDGPADAGPLRARSGFDAAIAPRRGKLDQTAAMWAY